MIEIIRYTNSYKKEWDEVVKRSKIDSFLFLRDYMDYHSERFNDYSFLVFRKGSIEAVLPGNINKNIYYSHQGLTYGGLIATEKIKAKDVIFIFNEVNKILKKEGIKKIVYKPVPLIYHKIPSQEDIYALFNLGAKKIGCNLSSTIFQSNKIKFNRRISKPIKNNVIVKESENFKNFWDILNENLSKKYNTKPVHTIEEIILLHSRFPNNIKLFVTEKDNEILGGCVLYIMEKVIHVQYIAANNLGKSLRVLDLLFHYLINEKYSNIPIFDFGNSTEKMGLYLNENLIFQKESFGARGIVYEIYEYEI